MNEYLSRGPEETEAVGRRIASRITAPVVVALYAPLGGGKTTLMRGLARGWGYDGPVTSPSYTIVTVYEGEVPIYHIDAYRIASEEDLIYLGLEDILYGDGIAVIEWAEKVKTLLPERHVSITIEVVDASRRKITVKEEGR
ncbi:tRNA (adenosine(37)-N6)-threonylcarbamoyltransferase complex ATPase subunit type 1 TsaE [Spirochaeta thermophila]|uniref:tRNA (adenosine(37)-N6)-threonylcarbamoyltransferase complex ATPase subunit type 1 TsaE n=1 Tax=Winmispira thermophila TaxID=154 RepID=UPI0008FC4225|nr:tRNA (adenosine(37)-N6)-threonylcarbamoyltransferase complex ATPase subunit type 1 TsaE [Spirochaeta thermophila]